ncbi:hypothetical protein FDECE_3681 [Fusarium decemcellulare]|nr:hypothetical protein FDECE_3681 [Fusarium decemcellulare]
MASLTAPRRLALEYLYRAPSSSRLECPLKLSLRHRPRPQSCTRTTPSFASCSFSTTTPFAARPSTSRTRDVSPKILRKPSSKAPPASSSEPESPDLEAIRAAEKKEAMLRAARLRRTEQLREEASEEQKKEQAKKEYDNRYNTAARKYRLFIIAMPILLVTSYMLFVRILRGNDPNGKPITQKKEEEQETGS